MISTADRPEGGTAAPISGTITAEGLTADHVDLLATWTEQVDAEIGPGVVEGSDGIRVATHAGRVQTWPLKTTDPLRFIASNVMHQFGDTKHRQVTYQLTATSRFREYFPADLVADPANITNKSLVFPLTIKSSARPPQPKVLYVVPTYRWSTSTSGNTTTRTRTGGALRVYVDRPWFCSGDGEMLAVLLHAPNDAATNLPDYVSQWGVDPIWFPQSEAILPLDKAHFVVDSANSYDLGTLQLAENGSTVGVLGFTPRFNKERDVWYFDIELATTDTIDSPFVRLALARVQPTSVGNLHLSTVVRADMIKLAGDRTAALTQNADASVDVTVTGRIFANEIWVPLDPPPIDECDPEVPRCRPTPIHNPPAKYPGYAIDPEAASGHVVTVQIEESTVPTPGELDWKPLGGAVVLDPCHPGGDYDNYSTLLSFKGHVPFPTGAIAGAKHRLVIREWEIYESDDAVADSLGWVVHVGSGESMKSRARIAYTDVLALPN
jgi:hypothetical protein